MSEGKKNKWQRVGSVRKSKPPYDKNPDGSDNISIYIDKTVTLREGEYLSCFVPKDYTNKEGKVIRAPDYVLFDVARKLTNIE